MIIQTSFLGEIEIEESSIINFPEGIPGFEQSKRYVIIPMGEASPFFYLQSLDEKELCLLMGQPFVFFPNYEFDVPDEELQKLEINDPVQELAVYVIISVPEDFKLATANLLAPVVINTVNRKGMQYVPGKSIYSTRHYIFPNDSKNAQAGEVR
ncbi:MAG: flagellar assembly protein FliW [Deltaproteobacteria bacterium]